MPPAQQRDLGDWIASVELRLKTLAGRSQIRPPSSGTVAEDVLVGPGRRLAVRTADGTADQVLLGQDGPQRVARFYRTDGTLALSVATATAAPQAVTLWDVHGAPVIADDPLGGGLARPYIPWMPAPARPADWYATSAAIFEDIVRFTVYKTNPRGLVAIGHLADTGTAGEVRITVAGDPVGTATAVTDVQGAIVIGPFDLPGAHEAQVEIRVQARVTTGAGAVRIAALTASGYHA